MLDPIFKTPAGKHYFFGYYDKSQVSKDGECLLAMEVDFLDRLPSAGDVARIGYFQFNQGEEFIPFAETKTFNWQQGAMLQWVGDGNSEVIYNDLHQGTYASVIHNINTGDKRVLPMATYALSPDGKKAVCIDNERHHWCRRGYSYDGISNPDKNQPLVDGDGIFLMDLSTGEKKMIVSVEQMLRIKPLSNMKGSTHYLEHMMFSPNGERFAFLHRWKMAGGIYSRLYTAKADGSDLYLLNDSGKMSHFCWKDAETIFGWGGAPNTINTLRKYKTIVKYFFKPLLPLYKKVVSGNAIDGTSKISGMVTGESYLYFKDKTRRIEKVSLEVMDRDGHPTFCPVNDRYAITDTYPDKSGLAKLLLYDAEEKEMKVVDELKSLQQFDNSPNRCDLHPKWSFDGRYISIDTMNDGCRSIFLYDVSSLL